MTKLSVNVNKVATLRNARGGSMPNVLQVTLDCERFGAEGITIHPRPDERHITYQDVIDIKDNIATELNIEGYPNSRFMEIVDLANPAQATLVPDGPDVLTSNAGWDTVKHKDFLIDITKRLKKNNIRVSIFVDPVLEMIEGAKEIGADRVELYTEAYAALYPVNKVSAVKPYVDAANLANDLGLGVNAGHDLDMENLQYLKQKIPFMAEVSIGHALISDALYLGLENVVQLYKRQLSI